MVFAIVAINYVRLLSRLNDGKRQRIQREMLNTTPGRTLNSFE